MAFPVATIAARAAQLRRHHAARQGAQAAGVTGLGQDITIGSGTRIALKYWWALPAAGAAIYASYRLRKREGKGRQMGEVILDSVNILSAIAGIIALLEMEAAKTATVLVAAAPAPAAPVSGMGDVFFEDYPEAARMQAFEATTRFREP